MTFKMSDILSITLTATTSFIKKSTLMAVYIYLMCGATCVCSLYMYGKKEIIIG